MNWLVTIGLTNAVGATLLAAIAWIVARCWRQPALVHLLWVIVLLKLFTPPLLEIPVGWKLDVTSMLQHSPGALAAKAEGEVRPANGENREHAFDDNTVMLPASHGEAAAKHESLEHSPTSFHRAGPTEVSRSSNDAIASKSQASRSQLATMLLTTLVTVASWLPLVWLGGSGIRAMLLAHRAYTFRALIDRVGCLEPALSRRVQQLARTAGWSTAPPVIKLHAAVSPMLWGVGGRIQLIFPARLADELSPTSRDSLLLHELAHYSRGDQWIRLLELMAEVVFWWHPVVWWARQEIEAAEEQCCDAWVIERQSAPRRTYAEALLATIDFLCDQPSLRPPAASGLGTVPLLRIRLRQIMCGDLSGRLSARTKTAVFIGAMVILPLAPALFGASLPATRVQQLPDRAERPQTKTDTSGIREPASSTTGSAPGSSASNSIETPSSAASIPAAPRPPAIVTATATSRNGKYRLERRKGSHVTLVNQSLDWRLDMSTHGILCVAFTPDSRLFVTGHEDGLVRVWDSETGGLATMLRGSSDAVWSIAVGAGPRSEVRIAAGGKDGSVLVWDLASSQEIASLPPSASSVSCLRWSAHGDKLAISFGDFSDRDEDHLLIWSPLDNAMLAQSPLDRAAAALAWLDGGDRLLVADWNGDAHVWRASTGSPQFSVSLGSEAKQRVEAAHWSADCSLVSGPLGDELAVAAK